MFAERPADSTLLLPSIEVHQQRLGRIPRMVAADAGFYSSMNEKAGQASGVRWMSVPNKKTTSSERRLLHHQRWFRNGQKWRTGSEGRISVLKRRHALRRSLYPGREGMRRWVGLGVIADNVIQMGCHLARQST
jgi:IS5 family transposase